jgi:hypothetical protein
MIDLILTLSLQGLSWRPCEDRDACEKPDCSTLPVGIPHIKVLYLQRGIVQPQGPFQET